MNKPEIERHGNSFVLAWRSDNIGFGIERIVETKFDGLKCMLVVEGWTETRRTNLAAPISMRLNSLDDQRKVTEFLAKRVNSFPHEKWETMVLQMCRMVSEMWYETQPIIDLATYEGTRVEYVVGGLMPEHETTVLYGDGESAKSLCALMLSACLKTGTTLPWGDRPKQQNVLYLDWETNANTIASRIRRICMGMSMVVPKIQYRTCYRSLLDDQEAIRNEISRNDINTVIIDSIGFAMGGSLNDDDVARAAMSVLRSFEGTTRLVVAHVSKAQADMEKGRARPFGSIFFWNGMRSGIEVRRAQDQPEDDVINVGLYHQKANDGAHHKPVGLRISFDGLVGPIAFDLEDMAQVPELGVRLSMSSRVRSFLKTGSKTTPEISEYLESTDAATRTTLRRMKDVIQLTPGTQGRGNSTTWGLAGD